MATITANIDATQTTIPVSTSVVVPGTFYTIGSEAILVHGNNRGPTGRAFNRLFWSVDRGVAGTTAASHSSGATLTQYYPDAEGGGGGGGSGPVLVATTLLTSAQILAMHDTPVELVPAPGAGKAIAVINIAAALAFATTSYETGEDLDVTYDGDANTLAAAVFTAFLTADASGGGEFATSPQKSITFVGLLTAVENKAVVATCLTANPENGDSDVLVTILYAVVDLA